MSITYDSKTQTFFLDGQNITYAFFINDQNYAEHLYYGATIPHDSLLYTRFLDGAHSFIPTPPGKDDTKGYQYYPSELTFYGCGDYREPCVLTETVDGDRVCELLYDGYEILNSKPPIKGMPSLSGDETLIIRLKDKYTHLAADLFYTIYENSDVIARRVVYYNEGESRITLRRAYSFTLSLPGNNFEILSLYGVWAKERHIQKSPLHHGVVSIDSKRTSSSAVLNPFMAVMSNGATEICGEVWGISLVYSSSFVLKAQGLPDGDTLVTGGIQDLDFSWQLNPSDTFETPEVVIAFSNEGLGGMSRAYHRVFRAHLINPRFVNTPRPLLINNWEGTYFDFDTNKLKAIVDAVADTGIDTFVLDDGWFGKRDDARSGLGDWFVNTRKLDGGLKPLIDYVHSKGMRFGLWFEPEMVSEDSDLFRAHPEYAIGVPSRPRCYERHQYMLDLTRPEVCDHIVNTMNRVLSENKIDYVKWDYNRNVTEFFAPGRDPSRQAEFSHRYALGLYNLCERIVEANPHVFFEGCSGGGARFDPAMLRYFPQIWTSDNTDAEDRTLIQYGTSLVYPLSAMSCHVSICPNHQTSRITPFETRAHIASLGAMGYELDTTLLTSEDHDAIQRQTKEYRKLEDLILDGDVYRLANPFEGNFFSMVTVSRDKKNAVLTAYRRMGSINNEIKRIRVVGLDPLLQYTIPELGITVSGATLSNVGLIPKFTSGDFRTIRYHFHAN